MATIAFHEITKQFPGTSQPAVDAVTFEVPEGTIAEWFVPVGAAVAEVDSLLRLATYKVDVDF